MSPGRFLAVHINYTAEVKTEDSWRENPNVVEGIQTAKLRIVHAKDAAEYFRQSRRITFLAVLVWSCVSLELFDMNHNDIYEDLESCVSLFVWVLPHADIPAHLMNLILDPQLHSGSPIVKNIRPLS